MLKYVIVTGLLVGLNVQVDASAASSAAIKRPETRRYFTHTPYAFGRGVQAQRAAAACNASSPQQQQHEQEVVPAIIAEQHDNAASDNQLVAIEQQ